MGSVKPHRTVIVVFDGLQLLDLVGPVEVLAMADFLGASGPYERVLVSPGGAPVRSTSGLSVDVGHSLAGELASRRRIDTLLVVGGVGVEHLVDDPAVVGAVARLAARAARTASVCSGALLLAAAGVLDGRTATTHWSRCDDLARRHPAVTVDGNRIFVADGPVWTSAGVTAGIDLTLALVARDLGDRVAQEVAAWLVVFSRRPGGQSQFSVALRSQQPAGDGLGDLLAWLPGHLDGDLSVAALAARAHMSPRTFARTFARQVGTTPAAHVEQLRIESARTLLATTDLDVAAIARRVGFARAETLHRAFRRVAGTTPDRYRQHFSRLSA